MPSAIKFDVSPKKKATINKFKDHVYLHFNEFNNGNQKSITFSENEFYNLQKLMPKFEKAIRKLVKEQRKKKNKSKKIKKTKKELSSDNSENDTTSEENTEMSDSN